MSEALKEARTNFEEFIKQPIIALVIRNASSIEGLKLLDMMWLSWEAALSRSAPDREALKALIEIWDTNRKAGVWPGEAFEEAIERLRALADESPSESAPCRNATDSETLAQISELLMGYREGKNVELVDRVKFLCELEKVESAPAPEGRDERAKELADLLCPVHANLDKNDHLEPFDNCIACIRNERDELRKAIAAERKISDGCRSDASRLGQLLEKANLPAPEGMGRDNLECGHPLSFLVKSVESDYQFCEYCECKKERNDALQMEAYYKAKLINISDNFKSRIEDFMNLFDSFLLDSSKENSTSGADDSAETFIVNLKGFMRGQENDSDVLKIVGRRIMEYRVERAHPTSESGTDNSVTPADDLTADDNWCPDCGEPRELCLCTNFNFNWDARAKKVYWRTCSTCGDIDRSELAKAMKYAAEEYVKYLDRRKSESGRDDDFWQSEYVRQSKEILQLAGMPDDFKTVGVDHAIESLRKRLVAHPTSESGRVEEQDIAEILSPMIAGYKAGDRESVLNEWMETKDWVALWHWVASHSQSSVKEKL